MNNSLIQKIVNRSNLTTLAWSIAGLLLLGALIVFNIRYLYNFILGPFDVTEFYIHEAYSYSKQPFEYWVNLNGETMINTGVQYVETSDNGKETVKATYFAMPIGDRLLLVSLEGDQQADTLPVKLTGWLAEVNSEEQEKIIQDIETNEPALKGLFLPYKLQTGNFRIDGFIGIAAGLVLLIASAWGLVLFFNRTIHPNEHPIMKSLARFGPLDFVTNRIEMELAVPHTTIGNLHFTNSWLVYQERTNLIATRYEDVVWVFKFLLRRKSYGITVGKTYSAKVYDRFGVLCNFVAGNKEEKVNQMLDAICQHTPWAVMGWSQELENAWKKDKQGFLSAVERRKVTSVS